MTPTSSFRAWLARLGGRVHSSGAVATRIRKRPAPTAASRPPARLLELTPLDERGYFSDVGRLGLAIAACGGVVAGLVLAASASADEGDVSATVAPRGDSPAAATSAPPDGVVPLPTADWAEPFDSWGPAAVTRRGDGPTPVDENSGTAAWGSILPARGDVGSPPAATGGTGPGGVASDPIAAGAQPGARLSNLGDSGPLVASAPASAPIASGQQGGNRSSPPNGALPVIGTGQTSNALGANPVLASVGLTPADADTAAVGSSAAQSPPPIPVSFEPNLGQFGDSHQLFAARSSGGVFYLAADSATLVLPSADATAAPTSLGMSFVGANPDARATGLDRQAGVSNHFLGNDPSQWFTDVPTYSGVSLGGVYQGIDLVYHGAANAPLEYDWVVAPNADPGAIRLAFSGASAVRLDTAGNLILDTAAGPVTQHAPVLYQDVGGTRQAVEGRFVLNPGRQVSFSVGEYDHSRPLVIDPIVSFSTYLGGCGSDMAKGVAVDSAGNTYVTGIATSLNFPTSNPFQSTLGGQNDAFVTKLDPCGEVVYSTYLGGGLQEEGAAIAVDASGSAYVTGFSTSANFPTTGGAYQSSRPGTRSAYVTKLSPAGNALVYSTYLGGSSSDQGFGIAVDSSGNATVAGQVTSANFPTLKAFQTTRQGASDAFVTRLNAAGSGLVYSTYLGGTSTDAAAAIALDAAGNAYVTGTTASTNFPTATPYRPTYGGANDAFVTKLKLTPGPNLSLGYSTYLGGSGLDAGTGVAVDPVTGVATIAGYTASANFPTASPLQTYQGGTTAKTDAFVTKLTAAGSSATYSTYLGGSGDDYARGVAVDSLGNATVVGQTASTNFPNTAAVQIANAGQQDVFATKLNDTGSAYLYSTYLGGAAADIGMAVAVDPNDAAHLAGYTSGSDMPLASASQTTICGGSTNAIVAVIEDPVSRYRYPDPQQGSMRDIAPGIGYAMYTPLTGDLITSHLVDVNRSPDPTCPSCACQDANEKADPLMDPAGVSYNSGTINPRPVIVSTVRTSTTQPVPVQIQVTLTWNGVAQPTQTFTVPVGHSPGDTYLVSVEAPTVSTTGLYHWQTEVKVIGPGSTVQSDTFTTDSAPVVASQSTPFGPGWSVPGLDHLVVADDGFGHTGVMWVSGTGYVRFFCSGSGNAYLSPADDFGTLAQNPDGSYTYTVKDRTVYTFDSQGRLTAITDTHGIDRTYTYDGSGRPSTVTSPDGGVATYTYDGTGHLAALTTPGGAVTTFTYDANGDLSTIADPGGGVRTFTYDAGHHLTHDQWGANSITYTYDASGHLSGIDQGAGNTQSVVPQDSQGLGTTAQPITQDVATVTDGLGRTTSYAYDDSGRQTQQTYPDGSTDRSQYDFAGDLVRTTDELGRVTTYTYQYGTGEGDLIQVTRLDGGVVRYQYEPTYHHVTRYQDSLGRVSTFTYDPATGDLTSEQDPLGGVTAYTYYLTGGISNGLVHTATDPLGHTTSYAYDANRRQTQVTDPVGNTTTTTYDPAGNLATTTDALGRTTSSTYDGLHRQTTTTDALGGVTTTVYDPVGHVTSSIDALGRTTTFSYDPRGHQTGMTEAVGTPQQRTTTNTYDSVGNVISTIDPLGRTTTFSYDTRNRQTGETDAVGTPQQRTTTTTYDAAENVTSTTDPRGFTTSYSYDALNRQTRMIEAVGTPQQRTTTTTYDSESNVTSVIDPRGFTTTFSYDALNRRTGTTEAVGTPVQRTSTTAYDAAGNVTTTIDARGFTTSYAYDADNRQTRMTEAVGTPVQRTTTTAYDPVGNVLSVIDPRGVTTSYAYDALNRWTITIEAFGLPQQRTSTTVYDAVGNVTSTTEPAGKVTSSTYDALDRRVTVTEAVGTPVQRTTTTVYDAADNITATIDPLGRTTSYAYDALNRRTSTTEAVGTPVQRTTTSVYDTADNVVSTTNPRGFTTTYAYDPLNRRVGMTESVGTPVQRTTTTVYDANDNVTATTNGRGFTTSYSYDALNRQVTWTDPLLHTTTTTYDANDNVVRTTDPLGFVTTSTYDALNRRTSLQAPSGGVTTTVYDANDNVVRVTDPLGHTTTSVYDPLNRLTNVTDARGGVTTTTYDPVDNRTSFIDQIGNQTTYSYDDLDREVLRTDPQGHTTTTTYDAGDRLTSRTDRDGRRIDYAYDQFDRLTSQTWVPAGGPAVNVLTYTYDADDNLLTGASAAGAYTMTYDALDRMATRQEPLGLALTYAYDAAHNRTRVQDSLGGVTTSAYDADDRLTRREFDDGSTQLRIDLTYTARDELATETRYSDLAGTTQVGSSVYTYDGTGRLTNLQHRDSVGSPLTNYAYTYDLDDRLANEQISGTVQNTLRTYTYDATNELLGDGTATYTYDLAGNRTNTGYALEASPSDNRLATDGTWNFTYDDEGNLTKKVRIADGLTWTYGYDHRDQMTFAEERATDGGTLLQRVDYTYDVFGDRVEKDVSAGGPAAVQRFAYDGDNVWADLDGTSALVTRRLYLDGEDHVAARITAVSGAAWYLTDRLGSIRDVTDAAGMIQDHTDYDSFGGVLSETNPSFGDRYKYTGREFDSETGLQYNRARVYDPTTGRWTSQDPIGFRAGDPNLYRYVGNDPTNATDPSGNVPIPRIPQAVKDRLTDPCDLIKVGDLPSPGKVRIFQVKFFDPGTFSSHRLDVSVTVSPKWLLTETYSGETGKGGEVIKRSYTVKTGITVGTEREIQAKVGSELGVAIDGIGAKVTSELSEKLKFTVVEQKEFTKSVERTVTISPCVRYCVKHFQLVEDVSYTAVYTSVYIGWLLLASDPVSTTSTTGKFTVYSVPERTHLVTKELPK